MSIYETYMQPSVKKAARSPGPTLATGDPKDQWNQGFGAKLPSGSGRRPKPVRGDPLTKALQEGKRKFDHGRRIPRPPNGP